MVIDLRGEVEDLSVRLFDQVHDALSRGHIAVTVLRIELAHITQVVLAVVVLDRHRGDAFLGESVLGPRQSRLGEALDT